MEDQTVALSGGTQGVLLLFGISVIATTAYILWLLIRAVSGLIAASPATQGKPTKQQPASSQQPAQQSGHLAPPQRERGPDLRTLVKQAKAAKKGGHTKEDVAVAHALWINTLKGHGDAVSGIAWSADGRMLATACADMTIRLFDCHEPGAKDLKYKFIKTPQPPLAVGFGDDPASVVAVLRGIPDYAHLVHYTAHKAKASSAPVWEPSWQVQRALGAEPLLAMAVVPGALAAGGRGVAVLLSTRKEGRVFSLAAGRQVGQFEPNSLANHGLAVAANGRFIAVPSFTADVKVWEVESGKEGLKGVAKAMDLKGHSSQVLAAAISPDGSRAVTASKDGSLRIWNLSVRYHMREDPKVLLSLPIPVPGGRPPQHMAWGPGGVIAAALGDTVHFLDAATGGLVESIVAHDGDVLGLAWAPKLLSVGGQQVAVLATCSSDRRARLWRAPGGDDSSD